MLPFTERAGFFNPALKTYFKNTLYYYARIAEMQEKFLNLP